MAVSSDYDWVSDFGSAACVTIVVNGSALPVLEAFEADVSTPLEGDERSPYAGPYDVVVAVFPVPGGVVVYEANGYHGSLREVVSRLADGGRVASMYWNEDAAMPSLTCAEGRFLSTTELFDFGDDDRSPDRDDELPPGLDVLAEELAAVDFDTDESQGQMLAIGFAMMEQFCGVGVPRTIFDGPEPPSYPILG
ncbi:DUF6461 domain-containing protein [Nocardioides plantarum]|uniref:DUF6461 domain-containing protein n=1 Tax=Nocardioides plantarum TaxID=29299 RepID=A0ABV5KG49_9ACTN|nr:DUF6461 domain-containing protein [Nocardioides plantarum]